MGPVSELSLAAWHDTLDTNLTSAFLGAKYQVPAMIARGGGSLIFTSSFVGYTVGMPGMAAYAASKAGQIGLVKVLAAEFGAKGIRANAILPGGTDTPASITNAPGATPEVLAFVEGLHALKRMATPEEIARSVLHLASDASSFITGTALPGRRRRVDLPDVTGGDTVQNALHDLTELLFIALLATLCGATSCTDMALFARTKAYLLEPILKLKHGLAEPRHVQPSVPHARPAGLRAIASRSS